MNYHQHKRSFSDSAITWFERHGRLTLWSLLLVAGAIYLARNPQYRTGSFNDDAIYVLGARDFWKSAAERSPLLMRDYPFPGLPLLLSPFAAVVSTDWVTLEWITVGMTLIFVAMMSYWSRKWMTVNEAWAITALLALNPLIARLSGAVMAANFYITIVVASFWLMSKILESSTWKKSLLLGFLIGWASLIRTEGFVVMAAILIGLLSSPRGRKSLPMMSVSLLIWSAFAFYWFRIRSFPGNDYASDLWALKEYWQHHFWEGLAFTESALKVFINHAFTGLPTTSWLLQRFNIPLGLLILGIAILGFYRLWQDRPDRRPVFTAIALYLGFYSAIHLFWHAASPRYGIAMLPFLLLLTVRGARSVGWLRPWRPMIFLLLISVYGYQNAVAIGEVVRGSVTRNAPPWNTLDWMKTHLPPDAHLMSNIAPTLALYSAHTVMTGIENENTDYLIAGLLKSGVSHVLIRSGTFLTPGVGAVQNQNEIWARMRARAALYPQRFRSIYHQPTEEVWIYQLADGPDFQKAMDQFVAATADYQANRLESAERQLRAALKCYPSFGSAYSFLGAIALHRQRLAEAGLFFLKASELLPDDPRTYCNLATIYRMADESARAEEGLQRSLEMATAIGQADLWSKNIQDLRQAWEQKKVHLFLSVPPANSY